jgi:hypothetical protein
MVYACRDTLYESSFVIKEQVRNGINLIDNK